MRVRCPRVARAITLAAAILGAAPCYSQEAADTGFSLGDAIMHGRPVIELRPRYNYLDEADYPEDARGGTMRTVLGWVTAPWYGIRVRVEVMNASHLGSKQFNDDPAQINTSPYPLLPDPLYTGVNQAYAEYTNDSGLRVKLGRQVVRFDNQRWVSDNDFRQIPQLFEGANVAYMGFEGMELSAGYYDKVRTTSGITNDLRLTTLRAAWNPYEGQSVIGYAIFHDQAANGAFTGFADNSYRVVGVKAEGAARVHDLDVPYIAEYAQQRPYANGDSRVDANYWRLGAGVSTPAWTARYDYEVKGSNGGQYGVQMPLTDFYQYNGWTLSFFTTPRQGLHDQWLTLRWQVVEPLTFYGEAHKFRSDFGGLDFGRENDVGLTWSILQGLDLRLQYARYDPGSGTSNDAIRKTWLTLSYSY
jgi:Alginate export